MERRHEERVLVNLPVTLEHVKGVTRNVSGSGVYLEFSSKQTNLIPGKAISFSLKLDDARKGALRVNKVSAQGEILRVEQYAEKIGVATAITAYKFEPEK
ncbi:MAG: PilZ domain-containing protein [Burkholderiales bacterium]